MKRILIMLLIACLLLCACTPNNPDESSHQSSSESSSSSESESSSSEQSSESSSSESSTSDSYLDIERFEPKSFKNVSFAIKDSKSALTFEAPNEWSFTKTTSNEYDIKRGGNVIGGVLIGTMDDLDEWSIISEKTKDRKTVIAKEYVEQKGTDYRYRWEYSYTEDSVQEQINIVVTCAEVPSLSSYRMLSTSIFKQIYTEPSFGGIDNIADIASPQILIVGNSFVGTSNIGAILDDMLMSNGKNGLVNAISIGMGNIGRYSQDDYVLGEIATGNYDLVVMSGFYGSDDSASLRVIKEICDDTDTTLVTLPAHNENITSARKASRTCEVKCLEWKTEIDNFIDGGVSKWALCINDSYYHSTELAGYIGAHMIYRAIYSECPSEPQSQTISQSEVDRLLGDYSSTGRVEVVDTSKIRYLG